MASTAVVAVMAMVEAPVGDGTLAQVIGFGFGAVVSLTPVVIEPLMKNWPRLA